MFFAEQIKKINSSRLWRRTAKIKQESKNIRTDASSGGTIKVVRQCLELVLFQTRGATTSPSHTETFSMSRTHVDVNNSTRRGHYLGVSEHWIHSRSTAPLGKLFARRCSCCRQQSHGRTWETPQSLEAAHIFTTDNVRWSRHGAMPQHLTTIVSTLVGSRVQKSSGREVVESHLRTVISKWQ